MPGQDGYSLIRKIRDLSPERGGKTPAVAMTAFAAEKDIQRALSAGFQAHLAKPVDGQDLAKMIFKLAGKKAGAL
jgi:CheY-like chemotaxis protein